MRSGAAGRLALQAAAAGVASGAGRGSGLCGGARPKALSETLAGAMAGQHDAASSDERGHQASSSSSSGGGGGRGGLLGPGAPAWRQCREPGPSLLAWAPATACSSSSSSSGRIGLVAAGRFASSSSGGAQQQGGWLQLHLPSNPFAARKPRPQVQKLVLYRGRGMLLFRFIVRAKVFQLMGFLACAVLASVVLTTNNPDPMDLAAVGALAVGCVVTSYCIWYYSGRYVGEMSLLLPERRLVRFSVLDFWGNREDNDVPLERVVPPWRNRSVAEVRAQARQALMPLDVQGDRQYYISVPHGHVLQKDVLQQLLYGAPLDGGAAPAAAGTEATVATETAGKAVQEGSSGTESPAAFSGEAAAAGEAERKRAGQE